MTSITSSKWWSTEGLREQASRLACRSPNSAGALRHWKRSTGCGCCSAQRGTSRSPKSGANSTSAAWGFWWKRMRRARSWKRERSEPQGTVRMSCPTALLEYRIAGLVAQFMVEYPRVQVHLEATNRRVDVMGERLDLALRVRFPPLEDSDLVMRVLSDSQQRLVACPAFLEGRALPKHPADLAGMPTLDWGPPRDHVWHLVGPQGMEAQVRHQPRYVTDDMTRCGVRRSRAWVSFNCHAWSSKRICATERSSTSCPAGPRKGASFMRSFRLAEAWCRRCVC